MSCLLLRTGAPWQHQIIRCLCRLVCLLILRTVFQGPGRACTLRAGVRDRDPLPQQRLKMPDTYFLGPSKLPCPLCGSPARLLMLSLLAGPLFIDQAESSLLLANDSLEPYTTSISRPKWLIRRPMCTSAGAQSKTIGMGSPTVWWLLNQKDVD